MMGRTMWRAMLIGAIAGLVVAAGLLGWVLWQGSRAGGGGYPSAGAPVLVIAVMPDAAGVEVPRVIDEYRTDGAMTIVRSIDPSMAAVVSGTSAQTLAQAFVFGGGRAIASSLTSGGVEPPSWIVVSQDSLASLISLGSVTLDVPQDMQVFDGHGLYSFASGRQAIALSRLPQLFDGTSYLSRADAKVLREQVGDALASGLASASPESRAALSSSMRPPALSTWVSRVGIVRRTGQ